jgi:DNA polymerase-1
LVTIKCDVDLDEEPDSLIVHEPDHEHLLNLVRECELNTWLKDLLSETPQKKSTDTIDFETREYETILDKETAIRWFKALQKADAFAFDTETDGLDPHRANLVGFSVCFEAGKAAYFPIGHDYEGAPPQLNREWLLGELQIIFNRKEALLVGQNIKFDLEVLHTAGIGCHCQLFDTLLAAYVLNKTNARLNLGALAKQYLNHDVVEFTDIAGKGVKQLTFNQIHLTEASHYAAEDADETWRLYNVLQRELSASPTLNQVFNTLDLPQLRILMRMECHGVLIDAQALAKQSTDLSNRLLELEKKAYDLAGIEFNLASPKQLREILFDQLKLPIVKKTPKGEPSTNEEVLQQLALDYPLPQVIIEHRSLAKLKSTYTDKLPEVINPRTGRIHTNYNQALTTTGRLSSSDPNLQNIPIRSEQGRKIREAFIAPSGYQILAADYSQVELRIIAHLSEDTGLLQAFADGLDIHRATAGEVFATPFANVTSDQRRSAKAINFGLLYGMSAFGLAKQLGVSRNEAQTYLETYFKRYPRVKTYLDETRALASQQGYVETLYGRRVYLPNIHSKQVMLRQAAERAAINAPMQGTAADLIKLAMIAVQNWIDDSKAPVTMIMQVHDELVFEVKTEWAVETGERVQSAMTSIAKLKVPLVVETGIGPNWEQAH